MENIYLLIQELITDDIKNNINIDEMINYSKGLNKKDIDGELIRSYYITYKNGIKNIFAIYINNKPNCNEMVLTDEIEVFFEEYLERMDFDRIFNETIQEIKNCIFI